MRPRDDAGAAALELALVVPLLAALLSLVSPLALVLHGQTALGSTAGDAVRFGTSRADHDRRVELASGGTLVVPAGALPSLDAVAAEAQSAWSRNRFRGVLSSALTVTTSVSTTPLGALPTQDCPSGHHRTVTVSATVDLGSAVQMLPGVPTKTLRASAVSCEE